MRKGCPLDGSKDKSIGEGYEKDKGDDIYIESRHRVKNMGRYKVYGRGM